jgi:hypothetical protein
MSLASELKQRYVYTISFSMTIDTGCHVSSSSPYILDGSMIAAADVIPLLSVIAALTLVGFAAFLFVFGWVLMFESYKEDGIDHVLAYWSLTFPNGAKESFLNSHHIHIELCLIQLVGSSVLQYQGRCCTLEHSNTFTLLSPYTSWLHGYVSSLLQCLLFLVEKSSRSHPQARIIHYRALQVHTRKI